MIKIIFFKIEGDRAHLVIDYFGKRFSGYLYLAEKKLWAVVA